MKKHYLFLLFLCFNLSLHSQIIFQEDFDGIPGPTAGGPGTYNFPSGWFLRNVDNFIPNPSVSYVNEAWERREDFGGNVLDTPAFSTSYYAPGQQADDWMWTPLIGPIPVNTILKWNAKAYDPLFPDGYEVRIMTAASGPPTGGTGVIGNQLTNSTQVFTIPAENSSWTARQLSLSSYIGQSIYIGFRNNSTDQFILVIDDVTVEVVNSFDAELLSHTSPSEYSAIPLSQASPISFKAVINNLGLSPLTNVVLNAKVYDESNNEIYSTSSAPLPSLAPSASAPFTTIGSYLPVGPGTYSVEYIASMAETDGVPANNIQTDSFTISDTTYSRAVLPVTGSLGIGAGNGGYLGQEYVVKNTGQLTSVTINVTQNFPPYKLGMAIFDYDNGAPGNLIYQSPDLQISDNSTNTYKFAVPEEFGIFAPNDTIVVVAVEVDSTLALALSPQIFTPGTVWIDWPTTPFGDWANAEDFGPAFARSFFIEANFGAECDTFPTVTPSTLAQTLCSGAATTAIDFTSDMPNTTYNWTNSDPSIGLAANGTGNIPSFTATNTTGVTIVANITVTPVIDEICSGEPVIVTITVNPEPLITVNPLEQSICNENEIETIEISVQPAGSFTWTRDNLSEVTGIAASGTGNIAGTLTNTTTGPVTVNFTITSTGATCNGTPVIASVTVDLTATVDAIADQTYCAGNIVSEQVISGNNPEATYNWTNDNPAIGLAASGSGNIPSFTAINNAGVPITANITVTPIVEGNGGDLAPEILHYKFNESGTSVTNYASNPPAGTATATIMGSLTVSGSDLCDDALTGSGNSSSTDFLNTGWATNLPGSFTISVKTSNIIPSSTLFYIFGDLNAGSFRCFTNGVAGPNNWILRGTGITDVLVSGGATVAPHTTTFVYDATVNTIFAYLDGVLVNSVVQPGPVINGSGPFKVMGYSTNVGAPLNGKLDDYRLYSRALTAAEVAQIAAACVEGGCGSESTSYSITVDPGADVSVSPGNQSICSGESINTIITTVEGSGYTTTWTRDNTTNVTGIPANGSGDISGLLVNTTLTDQTVVFTITTTDGLCTYTNMAEVLVSPQFEIDPENDIIVCNGATINSIVLSGTDPEGSYNWTNNNTAIGLGAGGAGNIPSFVATNSGTTPIVATIVVSADEINNEETNLVFNYTGEVQTFVVPAGVTSINIEAKGAQGAAGNVGTSGAVGGPGGLGGSASGTLAVTPGQILNLYVGGAGSGQAGGYNGGANGGTQDAGGGGGASDVRIGGTAESDRVISAGGGGGGGRGGCEESGGTGGNGGAGGAGSGGAGLKGDDTPTSGGFAGGGEGGNLGNIQGAFGSAGIGCGGFLGQSGSSTSSANGGAGGGGQECCCFSGGSIPGGGGGGGGYLGGGGGGGGSAGTSGCSGNSKGSGGGGGGGSSYTGSLTSSEILAGVNSGNGSIIISFGSFGGCTTTADTFTITVNPTPNAIASVPTQTVCSGTAITTIVVSGSVSGTVFNWTRDNTASATGMAASGSGNISGTLVNNTGAPVTVTFTITPTANGCTGTPVTATVIVNPAVTSTATPASQTVCSGIPITTIVLSGSVPGGTYNWTRDNTASVTGIAASGSGNIAGTLTNTTTAPVTVTFTITSSSNGCNAAPITATVLVNPTPTATATPAAQTICSGGAITTIVLSGPVSGTTYTWTRNNTATVTGIAGSGTGNISGSLTNTTLAPVTVTFTIIPSANGCPGTAITATVIVNPAPQLTATPATQTVCSGSPITPIIPGGGLPGSIYSWTRDNTATVTGIAASGTGNVAGTLTNNTGAPVTVTFTFTASANGCAAVPVTSTVIVNPRPVGTMSISPNPACVGSTVQFSATGGSTYSWSGPQGWTSNAQNPTLLLVNHLQAGKYKVTITNTFGCSVILENELTVFYPPIAVASYDVSTACMGSDLQLYGSGAGGYSWTGPNGFTSNQQNPVINDVTAVNSGIYILTVTSPNGCTATSTLNITINTPPQVSANPVLTQTCEGSSVQLTATGTGSFSWSGPAGWVSNNQNPVINNIPLYMTGIYTVTLTASTGCSNTASVEVQVSAFINATITATPDTVCEGQSLQLHADGGTSYLWNGPAGFNSNEQSPRIDNITLAHGGKYYVFVTNEGGCFGYAVIEITVLPSVKATAYASPNPVNEFGSVQFFASNGTAYQWTGPLGFTSTEQNPTIKKVTRFMAGVYTVTITNENGCPSVVKVNLRVLYTNKGGGNIIGGEEDLNTRSEKAGSVYPNPTNNFLYFETESKAPIEYSVYDVNGNIQVTTRTSTDNYIRTEQLSTGIYQIRWKPQDQDEWMIHKFVKIR